MTRQQKKLTITIRAEEGTLKAKLIDYLRDHPRGTKDIALEIFMAALGPMLLAENQSDLVEKEKRQLSLILQDCLATMQKLWKEAERSSNKLMNSMQETRNSSVSRSRNMDWGPIP